MRKRALVTGGAGFIGSHLCEELLSQGFAVDVLDNLSTGALANIRHLLPQKSSFRFIKGSVCDPKTLGPLVRRCDTVYHLAAAVGVKYVLEHTLESLNTNIEGTRNVLETASAYGKKVILASTSEVYGKHAHTPMKEDNDRVLGATSVPRWSYAESKAVDEFFALAYSKERGLPVVILRFFNVVGPRQTGRYGMVIPRFILCALRGKPLTVYGTGRQVRSFLFVKDAVRAVAALSRNKKAYGHIFNVGNPEPVSINRLAGLVKKLTRSSSKVLHAPYAAYYGENFEDALYRVPDTALIRRYIRFRPLQDLSHILEESIEYFKTRKARP